MTAVSNGWAGAQIGNGAQFNIMIGPSNVISGNDNQGVLIRMPARPEMWWRETGSG